MDNTLTSPFAVHAALVAQSQAIGGGQPGDGQRNQIATLTILASVIPCTISPVVFDFEQVQGGKSPRTVVEICEFLVIDGPIDPANAGSVLLLGKGMNCTLAVSNQAVPSLKPILSYPMKLWHGGLMPGGLLWRFMLVDRNYEV